MKSLKARAVAAGVLWALIAIVLSLAGLWSYLSTQSEARFLEVLETRHTQALVAVANNPATPEAIARAIGDPVYSRPYSGQYWQVENADGALYTSASLLEGVLDTEPASQDAGRVVRETSLGDERLLTLGQWLQLDDGSEWFVQVAASLDRLDDELAVLRGSLVSAFFVVAMVAIIAALLQVTAMLRPLDKLRQDVNARWTSDTGLTPTDYPTEVSPLVADINELMSRNNKIIHASRKQAADLAHAIKTPAAIMRNELEQLRATNGDTAAALHALDRLDAQLQRSLARMRADGGGAAVGAVTQMETALGRMERAFTALARNAGKDFSASYDGGLRVQMDQSDFEEVIGNLLDNALKWASQRCQLVCAAEGQATVRITIEDDGPGIPDARQRDAMTSGKRLDESIPGTGLGLPIAADLVRVYGGQISLGRSTLLGGLAVHIVLPVPGAPHIPDDALLPA